MYDKRNPLCLTNIQPIVKQVKLVNDHLEVPLPFKQDDLKLLNNCAVALQRLSTLKNKLQRHQQLHKD